MPAVLAHKAIMLLARDRLRDIYERLEMKMARGRTLTDLELRVRHLARKAYFLMSEQDEAGRALQLPPDRDWPSGLGSGVSRFAVMGAMGPDITGLSALLAPNQAWVFDTVHKGTPDSHREKLNAGTTDLALAIWKQSAIAMTERPTGGPEAARAYAAALQQIRAYVLGHLCHIAGDVIAHPFVNDVEWHVVTRQNVRAPSGRTRELEKFTHERTEGSLDARVASGTFGRDGVRSGQAWEAWWPTVDEVPKELFEGIARALDVVYHARQSRPIGLAKFEENFRRFDAPTLDADFVRDGYNTLSRAGLGVIYKWGYGSWLGILAIAILPLVATFPLAMVLPRGKEIFDKSVEDVSERALSEALAFPLAMNFLTPLVFGGIVASKTYRGVESEVTAGLVMSAFAGLGGFVHLALLPADVDAGPVVRWGLMFGLPVALGLVSAIRWLAKLPEDSKRKWLLLVFALPFLVALVHHVLLLVVGDSIGRASEEAGEITYGVLSGVIGVTLLVLMFWGAYKAREARIPEKPEPFPAERRHHVRLFDESSLFGLPNPQDATAPFEALYPTGVRPLLRVWWEGPGELWVRPRDTHLEWGFLEQPQVITVVPPPVTPMTVVQLAQYLETQVRAPGGGPGLRAAVFYPEEAGVPMLAGAIFADHGQTAEQHETTTAAKQAEEASKFRKLGTTDEKKAYVLFHAPKQSRAVRFDRRGAVAFDARDSAPVDGEGKLTSTGRRVVGTGTRFAFFLAPGDRISAGNQVREVTHVEGDEVLTVNAPFTPDVADAKYERLGSERETVDGYAFLAAPRLRHAVGESLMDYAGDLGALLCMGAASHLLDGPDLRVEDLGSYTAVGGAALATDVGPVTTVFRNWCLDRRQVDEWRLIVQGGARVGAAEAADPGARVLRERGFVPTMRKWLEAIDRVGESAVDPAASSGTGEATNAELSAAMAHLFNLPAPVEIARATP